MKTYVLYHAQCPDGFGAAWAIWKKMGRTPEYIPVNHHQPPPALLAKSTVYLVDFCYPLAITQQLATQAQKMVILDHHQSAQADLQKLDRDAFPHLEVHFDMQKSGAVLAWEYFHQRPAPEFLQYIQDKDLWQFKLPHSKEFSAALRSYEMSFEVWSGLEVAQLQEEGRILLRYQNQLVDKLCGQARMIQIGAHTVPAVNSSTLQSEVGNQLCQLYPSHPFAVVYFDGADKRYISLRSIGSFDVAAIAGQYGGGGHKNAAGFAMPLM